LIVAKHKIQVELPRVEVVHKDAVITVRGDGYILGTITISRAARGAIEWYSNRWRKPTRLDWEQFDDLMHREWTSS
jgi:hypothetical protein